MKNKITRRDFLNGTQVAIGASLLSPLTALVGAEASQFGLGAVPGTTMEDVVTSRLDYSMLDRNDKSVRIRLNSSVVHAMHTADTRAVDVTYVRQGDRHTVRAERCILACYDGVIPYLLQAPERIRHQDPAVVLVIVEILGQDSSTSESSCGFDDGGVPVGDMETLPRLQSGSHDRERGFLNRIAKKGLDQGDGLVVVQRVRFPAARRLNVELLQDLHREREVFGVEERQRHPRLGHLIASGTYGVEEDVGVNELHPRPDRELRHDSAGREHETI